jgi:hypothetical protein
MNTTHGWIGASVVALAAAACSAGGNTSSGVSGGAASASAGGGSASGASSSGASAGVVVGSGGLTVSTDAGSDAELTCGTTTQEALAVPLDLFILLDQSGSMTLEGARWDPVTAALESFVQNPAWSGIGVGLDYFPQGATTTEDPVICTPSVYATPEVPIAELPGNAAALTTSIDAHYFTAAAGEDPAHWGTPTRPAVEGTLQHLVPYQVAHPERKVVLLLATDGKPSTQHCTGNTIAGIAEVLAGAASAATPLLTYVIGIGDIENLNELAVAGGSGQDAFIVDGTGTTTEQEFAAALDAIRRLALPCQYPIPPGENGNAIDPAKVNVKHGAEGAAEDAVFLKVESVTDCVAGENNWYYDDELAPTAVVMCPAACAALSAGGRIDLVFGCDTEVAVR